MPEMRYAYQPDVLAHLKVKEDDVDTIARLIRLENGLAAQFDHACGRTFGETTVAPQLRSVQGYASNLLLLPTGIGRIDEVEVSDPVASDSRILDAGEWLPWGYDDAGNTVGLLLTSSTLPTWYGLQVGITGLWGDQDSEGLVPDDVREAMVTLLVKEFRRRTSSPSEQIGPDGMVVPAPSGWSDPTVKGAIAAHRVSRRKVGV